MKAEAWIFAGCGIFFLVVTPGYWFASGDPTGFAVLSPGVPVPALNWFGMALLSLLVAGIALRQRHS